MSTQGQWGGGMGGIPPSKGQKPTPYPKAKNWLPSKKFFILPPSEAKKIQPFLTVLLKKKCPNGTKKGAKFSAWSLIVEKIFICPPLPPYVTLNFTPPLESFWGVLHFLRHSSPHLEKSRCPCVAMSMVRLFPWRFFPPFHWE